MKIALSLLTVFLLSACGHMSHKNCDKCGSCEKDKAAAGSTDKSEGCKGGCKKP